MKRQLTLLHPYQVRAIRFVLDHPEAALWLDMGLGKTIVTLCALKDLFDRLQIFGVLIVAPLRVCQTVWRQEAAAWDYTSDISFELLTGNMEQRVRALRRRAMVYLINYENLPWLASQIELDYLSKGLYPPFDTVVLDEISRLKSTRSRQGGERGKAFLTLAPFLPRRIGLTGTPASNGYLDLFGQYLCLDGGQRLGSSFEAFKREFFYQGDYHGYRWLPFAHSENVIRDRIADITISMSNEDYLSLPPKIVNDIWVDLPPKARKTYAKAEKEFFIELDSGATIDITNEASLVNRCLQIANGAAYLTPGDPEWEKIHDAKLAALEEVVEEAGGEPLLVLYAFQHDAHRIKARWKDAVWLSASMNEKELTAALEDWNAGRIRIMLGHPASIGHGLNLQAGSSTMVWIGLNWSQDLYSQAIARLRRQGQTKPVTIHRIMARDTMDDAQRLALLAKHQAERSIRRAIEQYRKSESPSNVG